MNPTAGTLMPLVEPFLSRQGWFASAIKSQSRAPLDLIAFDVLRSESPGLGRLLLRRGEQHFQLLVGWRAQADIANDLRSREASLLGPMELEGEPFVLYEALADDALCLEMLALVTDNHERAERVRTVSSLMSHASLVFDDRLFMKCYRVLEQGDRPEVLTTYRLDEVGFNALPGPVGRLRAHDFDLAFVREYLPSALEGRLLALTSLRDLLAHAPTGADLPGPGVPVALSRVDRRAPDLAAGAAGGDLASETFRLGQTIARLHLALAEAFGSFPVERTSLFDALASHEGRPTKRRLASSGDRLARSLEEIGKASDASMGLGIHLHGELHLRRVMRSDPGWIVTGFSDDPLFGKKTETSLEPRTGSPIEDVADMFFSMGLVAEEALQQRTASEQLDAVDLAEAWVRRNQAAFLRGYLETPGVDALLPTDRELIDCLLYAYELLLADRYEATSADR